MFKFLENAPTSTTVAMGTVASTYIANLFKEEKVEVLADEGTAALVRKHLDAGDFARVSIKTGRRIG